MNTNSSVFRHCTKCGSQRLKLANRKQLLCLDCGFEYFHNVAAAVAGLITDDKGRLLVTVRDREPARGTWDLPGGFVDPDESAEHALIREIQEELGLQVRSLKYFCSSANIYPYKNVTYHTLDLAYICQTAETMTAAPVEEVADVLFVPPGEIAPARFGLDSIARIVAKYLKEEEQ